MVAILTQVKALTLQGTYALIFSTALFQGAPSKFSQCNSGKLFCLFWSYGQKCSSPSNLVQCTNCACVWFVVQWEVMGTILNYEWDPWFTEAAGVKPVAPALEVDPFFPTQVQVHQPSLEWQAQVVWSTSVRLPSPNVH